MQANQPFDQQQLTTSQFGASAGNYLSSAVHAQGADLDRLRGIAAGAHSAHALDLGCGAGHASYALAVGGARQVTAYDPSPQMLAVVAEQAHKRGLAAIETRHGAAERLPFGDDSFDLIVTRYSAHHWGNVPRALAECARVIVPGGRLIVIDMIAPEPALLDTSLQTLELLRDASHVRDYRASEWRAMLLAADFREPAFDTWKLQLDFASWIARIGTPPARVAALHTVFEALPTEAREYFRVTAENDFAADCAWFEAVA